MHHHLEGTHGDHHATFRAAAAAAATEDKTVAVLCYITLIGFIAAIFMHQNQKTQLGAFHLRQVLGMVLTAAAGWSAGRAVSRMDRLVLRRHRAVRVLDHGPDLGRAGRERPVPLLGEHDQRWFAGVFA